jgi:dienelactone hydrolase
MSAPQTFQHLGIYSDLVDHIGAAAIAKEPGTQTADVRQRIRTLLSVEPDPPPPQDARTEKTWTHEGLRGEEISWSVGFGPRTVGWLIRPEGGNRLPGVLALHGHDAVKWYGKEKIADGRESVDTTVQRLREELYEGRAFANALASEGFVVFAHDVFLWGSRRFPFETMPDSIRDLTDLWAESEVRSGRFPNDIARYNFAARQHEHLVAKYCSIIGTSIPALVSREDRIAASYLSSRPDIARIGCIGLSGGGCRAALLQATCDLISAAVVVGMMATYRSLLDRHVEQHTWMFFPPGLSTFADWPDVAACRAPSPLLVQYDRDDQLFPLGGMHPADRKIQTHYSHSGDSEAYQGRFYPGLHKFDRAMQADAFAWLKQKLIANESAS